MKKGLFNFLKWKNECICDLQKNDQMYTNKREK